MDTKKIIGKFVNTKTQRRQDNIPTFTEFIKKKIIKSKIARGAIPGKIINCPHCMGDGLDENMKTCYKCDGTGSIAIQKQ